MFSSNPASSTSNIMEIQWTILGSSSFHHTEMRTSHSQPITRLRSQIYANKWYPKIVWLLYSFSLMSNSVVISVFSFETSAILLKWSLISFLMKYVLLWLILDLFLLWLNAMVCMDEHVYQWWRKWRISKWNIGKKTSTLLLAVFFCLSIGVSGAGLWLPINAAAIGLF